MIYFSIMRINDILTLNDNSASYRIDEIDHKYVYFHMLNNPLLKNEFMSIEKMEEHLKLGVFILKEKKYLMKYILSILIISLLFIGCYPIIKWEKDKSYYKDKNGKKQYVKLYYKGHLINKRGKHIIDSIVKIN